MSRSLTSIVNLFAAVHKSLHGQCEAPALVHQVQETAALVVQFDAPQADRERTASYSDALAEHTHEYFCSPAGGAPMGRPEASSASVAQCRTSILSRPLRTALCPWTARTRARPCE